MDSLASNVDSERQAPASVASSPPAGSGGSWRGAAGPLGLVAAGGVFYALSYLPHPFLDGGLFSCPYLALTGHMCAGCGGTRAVRALAQGDVDLALTMHPLVALIAPLLVVGWFRWLLRTQGLVKRPLVIPGWVWITVLVTFFVFMVARNVPALTPYLGPGPIL